MAYPGQKPEVAKAKQRQTFPANRLLEWKENVSKTSGEGAGMHDYMRMHVSAHFKCCGMISI